MPISETTNAATATLAPRSRADRATNGTIAPCPIETRAVGPYAGMMMPGQPRSLATGANLAHHPGCGRVLGWLIPPLGVVSCWRVDGYHSDMSTSTVIIVIVIVVVAAIAILVGYQVARRKRTERLRGQFGPEYDRALDRADDQRDAESELLDRSRRHEKLELRNLDPTEREDFERRWSEVQREFVDDPSSAVRHADEFVVDVMSARGYPVDDFDQRADDLSVEHPEVTQRYREARRIARANQEGRADTEDLRQAVTSYRALVHALLDTSRNRDTRNMQSDNHTTERETRA